VSLHPGFASHLEKRRFTGLFYTQKALAFAFRCYRPAMTKKDAERGIDILAKSTYRDLKQSGYSRADIMAFASNILGHLTQEAKEPSAGAVDHAR